MAEVTRTTKANDGGPTCATVLLFSFPYGKSSEACASMNAFVPRPMRRPDEEHLLRFDKHAGLRGGAD